ncbi:MAG: glycosyltransferase [candidate division Zixibacteria bacterium]|nr:glycosyltransferase [candidate division Zixibacteria bacterium]
MPLTRQYSTSLRDYVKEWIDQLKDVEVLIGVPCYNNDDTIAKVISTAAEGLAEYYPDRKSAILVSDGGSLDDTREVASKAKVPDNCHLMVSIYRGFPGKGTSLRAIFEAAYLLRADACAVFDSDLRSITPEWVKLLIDPILDKKAGYVTPIYKRHKFDGTITNHIIYPMTRSLYGMNIRQPIGGDFGFSGELAGLYAKTKVWDTDIAKFGIDIWMTTVAINEGFNVMQASLGAKIHNPKDPAADLGPMFYQVVSTMFYLMGEYERKWMGVRGSRDVEIYSNSGEDQKVVPVPVSQNRLIEEFDDGFNHFESFYKEVLSDETFGMLKQTRDDMLSGKSMDFSGELWAKILYDFAYVFQLWNRNRRRLVDIITPIHFGHTASYFENVRDRSDEEAEDYVQEQAKTFEETKSYLINKFKKWEDN